MKKKASRSAETYVALVIFLKFILRHFTLRPIRVTAIRATMGVIPIWHEWWFQCISTIYVPVNNNIK